MLAVQMEPAARPSFQPAAAGGVLIGTILACAAIGALAGWAAGSAGLGAVIGGAIGIPVGVYAVYRRYRGFFT
jgi:F0F1-type ATP synthase assembly protein I